MATPGASRHRHSLTALAAVVALAAPTFARASVADEVRKVRAEIEAMLTEANKDLQRAPEAEKETTAQREKALALKKEIEAAKAEAAEAEAPLEKLLAAAKAADDALGAVNAKGEALEGWKKKALARVKAAATPSAALKGVVALALEDRAVVEAALDRVLAEPGAQAAAALDELAKTAATALPAVDYEKLGASLRASPSLPKKPDPTAMLDAFASAIAEAAACAGVDASELPGKAPRIVAQPAKVIASFARAGEALAAKLRAHREAIARAGAAALPKLLAALGSNRLAQAAMKLAIVRGLRDVVREATKVALQVHAVPLVAEPNEAPTPKSLAAVLRSLAKKAGVPCGSGGDR